MLVSWRYMGLVPYDEGLQLMEEAAKEAAGGRGTLLLLEHPPTVTLGRFGRMEDVLADPRRLDEMGVLLRRTGRGGGATFHCPGQLVGYPVVSLAGLRLGVKDYVAAIEKVIALSLAEIGVEARRRIAHIGVWAAGRKVASIGVRVSDGVASHGFALNVNNDTAGFGLISPCGLGPGSMASMREIAGRAFRLDEVAALIAGWFGRVFGCVMAEDRPARTMPCAARRGRNACTAG